MLSRVVSKNNDGQRSNGTIVINIAMFSEESKKISNDQELIQSDPTSCPQNQKGNN